MRGVAFQKTICININKDATVIRRKRSSVMTKEAGSFDGVDNARGAGDVIDLVAAVIGGVGGGVLLTEGVSIVEVVALEKAGPRVVVGGRFVCINKENCVFVIVVPGGDNAQ